MCLCSADLKNLKKSSGKYGISGSPRGVSTTTIISTILLVSPPPSPFLLRLQFFLILLSFLLLPLFLLLLLFKSYHQDNLFVWDVELSDFERSSKLYKDLEAYAKRLKRKASQQTIAIIPPTML